MHPSFYEHPGIIRDRNLKTIIKLIGEYNCAISRILTAIIFLEEHFTQTDPTDDRHKLKRTEMNDLRNFRTKIKYDAVYRSCATRSVLRRARRCGFSTYT